MNQSEKRTNTKPPEITARFLAPTTISDSLRPVKVLKSKPAALLATLFGVCLPALAQSSVTDDTSAILESLRKKHNLPALAVVVMKDGGICDRAATGLRRFGSKTPVTTNDVFHIGSCTKSMTATLAAMFIEDGKLRWDSTIADVFPELVGKINKQYEPVTVLQLLTHRGGCPGQPPAAAWSRAWQMQGTPRHQRWVFINDVLSLPPESPPGEKYIYSNQGYVVAGAMLEKIADKPWETIMRERLFNPLNMKTAGFGVPGKIGVLDQPWGHVLENEKIRPVQNDNPPSVGPAGTVYCSLDDLAHYALIHLRGEKDGGLLKAETFRKLHTPAAGQNYSCGWGVVKSSRAGGKILTHTGSNTMWLLLMWLAPEKDFSIIVATNIAGDAAEKSCDEVVTAMIEKWLPK